MQRRKYQQQSDGPHCVLASLRLQAQLHSVNPNYAPPATVSEPCKYIGENRKRACGAVALMLSAEVVPFETGEQITTEIKEGKPCRQEPSIASPISSSVSPQSNPQRFGNAHLHTLTQFL